MHGSVEVWMERKRGSENAVLEIGMGIGMEMEMELSYISTCPLFIQSFFAPSYNT